MMLQRLTERNAVMHAADSNVCQYYVLLSLQPSLPRAPWPRRAAQGGEGAHALNSVLH
jgi:hypothetical protein